MPQGLKNKSYRVSMVCMWGVGGRGEGQGQGQVVEKGLSACQAQAIMSQPDHWGFCPVPLSLSSPRMREGLLRTIFCCRTSSFPLLFFFNHAEKSNALSCNIGVTQESQAGPPQNLTTHMCCPKHALKSLSDLAPAYLSPCSSQQHPS